MPSQDRDLIHLVEEVRSGERYRAISNSFVERIAAEEFAKGRPWKETIKAVRSRLHQVGGAYQDRPLRYEAWLAELETLPRSSDDTRLRDYCKRMLTWHTSSRERLGEMTVIFPEVLKAISPLKSVLDLACGLNPLCLPWLSMAPDAVYSGCDIYADMVDYLNQFVAHIQQPGYFYLCDLTHEIPQEPAQVAFLLKTLPCLEQMDKSASIRLLSGLQTQHILVSFPARSLTGKFKGMVQNYSAHFESLLPGLGFDWHRFVYTSEIFYRLDRK